MIDARFDICKPGGRIAKTVRTNLPEGFDDLRGDDLLFICRQLENGFSEMDYKLLLLNRYARLRRSHFTLLMQDKDAVAGIIEAMDINLVDVESAKNILPEFTFKGVTYCGHYGDFSNVSIAEFTLCENFFNAFALGKNKRELRVLAEALYRPKDVPFKAAAINEHNLVFADLPDEYITAIAIVYSANTKRFFKRFPELFPKAPEGAQDKPKQSRGFDFTMYSNMMDDLAGGKFGPYSTMAETMVGDIFFHVNKMILKNDRGRV